ncbi:MAG TPA: hypothetical protein PKY96_13065 [Flavobacteriales bacterium]|nr:hypothetical protein [Flavobacteriales bacterium]
MPRRHLLMLLAAFCVSIAVRWPLLNRPLSGHHELCTALVLIALHNWHLDGFLAHHGAPAVTFTGSADHIPAGYTDAPGLRDGVLHYLSHPPLAFDLPHALFTLTATDPNPLGLQLFNIFFHLLTCIGLYLIVRELQHDGHAPLMAALLYLFMPAPLWFHGNAFMSDMFVQNAWVWHVLVALRALKNDRAITWPVAAWCAVTLFITTIISWPGVWAGVALGTIALWQWCTMRDTNRLRLVGAAALGVGMAIGYTAWRWLQVVDADALQAYFTGRYAERGTASIHGAASAFGMLALNYRINWLPLLLPLALLLWKRKVIVPGSRALWLFLALTSLPVLLEMLFLLEYTGHDFTALKAGLLLCGLGGLGLSALRVRWSWAALAATCAAGVLYFYRTNPPAQVDDGRFTWQMEQGVAIANEAHPDEMVFTLGFTPEPQVQWYAKRTLFRIDDVERAHELLLASGLQKGILFRETDQGLAHERITWR